jgi:hypothetical protein
MGAVKQLIPASRRDLRTLVVISQAITHLPLAFTRALTRLNSTGVRLHDSVKLKDYSSIRTQNADGRMMGNPHGHAYPTI